MPASNQLLDGAMVRAEVSAGNLMWKTSDPGTTSLPSNRILTWANYKSYINTSGTTQFSDTYCPTYSNMLTYKITTINAPNVTSATDISYCDTAVANYAVEVNFTPGNTGYATRVMYDNGVFADAAAGATSVSGPIDSNGTWTFYAYHIDGSGNAVSVAGSSASVTVNFLSCV